MLRLVAVSLLATGTLVSAQQVETFNLAAPAGWGGETIQIPPRFARDMRLKGSEHIRFAPGMMKPASDSFFSYAFAFELDPEPALSKQTIEQEFLKYYRGLCEAVLDGKLPQVDPSTFTLELELVRTDAKQPSNKRAADAPLNYIGSLHWVEPFVTKESQKLNLEIQTWSRSGRNYIFACVSTQGRGKPIWKQLHKIREGYLSRYPRTAAQANWPRWRGPADHGSTESGNYPVRLDGGNIVWRARLPGRGCSTPIVWNQAIYLTAPVDGKDAVLSLDWSGSERWRTTFGPEDAGRHRNGSGCNASPATDGNGVFVYFKSGTLAAVELDGSVRWQMNLVERFGKTTLFWDHGTSPVLTEKYVVMARMHHGESWVAAFDKHSGDIVWKVDRNYQTPTEGDHGYTTPLVIQHDGREAVLVWGAEHMTIHDTADGQVLWSCGDFNPDSIKLWPAIATPVIVDGIAVIAYGRNDRGIPKLHGIRLDGSGDVTTTNRVWQRDDVGTFVPSPVAYRGRVYLVGDRGKVECLDPATGKTIWSARFPKNRAAFYASPLIADGKLYAPREDGVVFVARVTKGAFELLKANDMQESVIGSPVPVMNRLLIRGENYLFCLASQ